MKTPVVTVIAVLATTVAAGAQAVPDLKGTWSGQWRTVIYGTNPHHPAPGTPAGAPRIREITFTMEIEGQDGRLLWGKSWSNPDRKEPFAATIAPDGKIIGSDMDGSLSMSIAAPDRLDAMCRFPASGSSWESLAHGGVTVDDPRCRQRVALEQGREPAPMEPSAVAPSRQPFLPGPHDLPGVPA